MENYQKCYLRHITAAILPQDMRHTSILTEFQVMLKMEGMIQTQWPLTSTWRCTRPEDDKDQLTLTDVT